jgi:type II restriction/modification system DNA methylase subunit YeeA
MNKAKLKTYAPQARKDFIAAVMARANLLGISEKNGKLEVAPSEKRGDVTLIAGQAWPAKVHEQRERLIKRMQKVGVGGTAETIAYTWFNRFAALRYMEIHDYLGHGHRVLSSREGGLPEIIAHATELVGTLPGLNAQQVADMKLAGNKDGELYRLLLVAQCNALSNAMPFLFERIDDESELLLPGNLERTDSVVAKLVEAIPEEDWNEVEVIGWLYQFYISEKKDEVIGKVVKSEDIPAATQLFTPNWIVQYLVQNSVGRLWLMANPASGLKSQWPYHIEPAEQTPEVQAQLDALIKTRVDEDGGSLNPETITVLDPACGSGHILVEAYEVLKGIYLERGYQARAIPRLILERNLFGLDIDDRAAQLAGFALLMKARADDRRLLDSPIKLNVMSLQESAGMVLDEFAGHLKPHGINRTVLGSLLDTFTHAKTFGSLIQIPKPLEEGLAGLEDDIAKAIENGDVFAKAAAQDLVPLMQQTKILAMKFDAVVANPPYMGGKGMNGSLKDFAREKYPDAKSDLFACFIERSYTLSKEVGHNSMVTMQSWMFLSSFERLRERMLMERTICTMAQIGYNSFPSMNSKIAQATAFVFQNKYIENYRGTFINLNTENQSANKDELFLQRNPDNLFTITSIEFKKIPGSPIAYWVSDRVRNIYESFPPLKDVAPTRQGLATGDNDRFLRYWFEVDLDSINVGSAANISNSRKPRWFPCNKGGEFRRWYGNNDYVVNWSNNGEEIKNFVDGNGKQRSRPQNEAYYFRKGLTWSAITSSSLSMRYSPSTHMFETKGAMCFPVNDSVMWSALGFTNSKLVDVFLSATSPTLDFHEGPVGNLPFQSVGGTVAGVELCVETARMDWNSYERSWDFHSSPLLKASTDLTRTVEASYTNWITKNRITVAEMKRLEEENNRHFIDAYGLADELTPDVHIEQITLTANPAYRYGGNLTDEEQSIRIRQDTMAELISYAIGCMMGRYSLNEPGLIFAHAGNVGFDATRYKAFPADADGIIPITDELWFEDDAANRIREFILAVWPASSVDENMAWLAESLGTKGNETPDETIRRYLASSFFKDHLQTYKKRPIYWLFSSGKQGAFQALVYLHRYHEGTLARMRAEYVVPLTGKMQTRIEMLEKDRDAASSTAARNKIAKQIESLKKKHIELMAYDEKLRHYADMRIRLDLDDGVKVNYGKFGDLLAEVKAVTGGASDD